MSKMILNGKQYLNGTSNFYDCSGVFIDTTAVIVPMTTFKSSLSYTAITDCYLYCYLVGKSNASTYVYIDGAEVGCRWQSTTLTDTILYPLKKGQTLTVSNADSSYDSFYYVYGVQQGSITPVQPVIYSDEEREVGVWRDGKPLYQRTFVYTPSSTISTTTVIANLSSEIEVKDIKGVAVNSQNDRVLPLCYAGNHFGTNFGTSASNDLQIEIYGDTWGTNYTFLATIQYTKTTDTAGSGTYTPSGALATHYSSTEHIVGTWYDGKTLYEKTVHIANYSPRSAIQSFAHGVANIDNGWVTEAIKIRNLSSAGSEADDVSKNITGNDVYGYNVTSNVVRSQVWGVGSEYIYVRNGGSNTSSDAYDVYVTIRYTKTN